MDRKTVLKETREYVENFLFEEEEEAIGDDDSFLESGLLDSTGILEVVTFLEEHYGIKLADDELIPENIDSLSNIATFVVSKTGSA